MSKRMVRILAMFIIIWAVYGIQINRLGLCSYLHNHTEHLNPLIADLTELNVKLTRGDGVLWFKVEKKKDIYDWSMYDKILGRLHKKGISSIVYLWKPPKWRARGKNYPPYHLSDYADYVSKVAERYGALGRGWVKYYELLNEPDLPKYFRGTPYQAYLIQKVGYITIKNIDPQAVILCPSITHMHNKLGDYAEKLLEYGIDNYCDVMNFHSYGDTVKAHKEHIETP